MHCHWFMLASAAMVLAAPSSPWTPGNEARPFGVATERVTRGEIPRSDAMAAEMNTYSLSTREAAAKKKAPPPPPPPEYDEDELAVSSDDERGSHSHTHDHHGDDRPPHSHHSSEHDHEDGEDEEHAASSYNLADQKDEVRHVLQHACANRNIKEKCFIGAFHGKCKESDGEKQCHP